MSYNIMLGSELQKHVQKYINPGRWNVVDENFKSYGAYLSHDDAKLKKLILEHSPDLTDHFEAFIGKVYYLDEIDTRLDELADECKQAAIASDEPVKTALRWVRKAKKLFPELR